MKIRVGPISFVLLLLRLWWPATAFIGLCAGMLLPFNLVLHMLDYIIAPRFIGVAWLLLLIVYILLGVAFTYIAARLLRRSFGSEEWRIQRRMAILSGFPFYALCLFFLTVGIVIILDTDLHSVEMIGAALVFYLAGSILFALTSGSYVILTLFFLRRSPAIAHQEKGK